MQRYTAAMFAAAIVAYASFGRAQSALENQVPLSPLPDEPELFGTFQGTYITLGGSAAIGFSPTAGVIGGEISLVRQTREFYWFGVYTDLVRDFEREQTRLSIGPEFGYSVFGLDLGYVAGFGTGELVSGWSVRPMLTIGYATVFGRVSHQPASENSPWAEVGLLLKYPFAL